MAELLKNVYNETYADKLIGALREVYPSFPAESFRRAVFADDWETLELKERMRRITLCLREALPSSYQDALAILSKAIPHLRGHGLENIIFPDFVEQFGQEDWEHSLPALAHFTCYGTSEFAVRPFLVKDSERMMALMLEWADSTNTDIRRLASEGCRPRLPWAMALPAFKHDPSPILPILEKLKADESDYVRRSVANNLNDIAKDHPKLVLAIAKRWLQLHNPLVDWVVKHGCRTLLKKGNPEALALFGFEAFEKAEVTALSITPDPVAIGDSGTITFSLRPTTPEPCRLRIEYGIEFVKATGTRSLKLFKITENTYEPGTTYAFTRRHSFREMTTRKHYPGQHALQVIVNGLQCARVEFHLVAAMSLPKSTLN